MLSDDQLNQLNDDTLQDEDKEIEGRSSAKEVGEENPILEAEKAAVEEERFSSSDLLNQDGTDPDEETIIADLTEKGAGADLDDDEVGEDFGMQIIDLGTETNELEDDDLLK